VVRLWIRIRESLVRISVVIPAIPAEIFSGFCQPLQENSGKIA
jgi:hypothetical protein